MHRKVGHVRVGVSGWVYPPWRGSFYPSDLPHKDELAHLSRAFDTVEINGTFYGTQSADTFKHWHDSVPDDFQFSVKAPRYITHILRLKHTEELLAKFFASGVLRLVTKLGPILWQLPPSFKYDRDVIENFLASLPHTTSDAAKIARTFHGRTTKATWAKTDADRPLRHVLEIRHESFVTPAFITQLRRHRVALCCADSGQWPKLMDVTADFVYCRLHGADQLYFNNFNERTLGNWAKRAVSWMEGEEAPGIHASATAAPHRAARDVYVYFDNTAKVHAPDNALSLRQRVDKLSAHHHSEALRLAR